MRISDWSSDVCSSDHFGIAALRRRRDEPSPGFQIEAERLASLRGQPGAGQRLSTQKALVDGDVARLLQFAQVDGQVAQIGTAPCRERVGQYVLSSVVAVSLQKKINLKTSLERE